MNSNSQSFQDLFALSICKNKTYIEIGANRPIKRNNTYLLEQHDFKGYSIEFNVKWKNSWNQSTRTNKIYFDNAIKFDYKAANLENKMSNKIGYLSCDIEPVDNTFLALQKVINDGVEFQCITFEHDVYQSSKDIRNTVDSFLKNKNYKIAVHDVYLYPEKENIFETWYVHNDIEFDPCNFDTWLKTLNIH